MEKVKIYTLTDPISKEIRYVGKTKKSLEKRLYGHIKNRQERNHRTHWIQSLIKKGFSPIIDLIDECEEEDWERIETYWISQFKFWGFRLVNTSEGGLGVKGLQHSNFSKKKMSNKGLGRKFSEEHRDKLRKHLKKFQNQRQKPIIGVNIKTSQTKKFDSIKCAAKELGVCPEAIGNCLKGRTNNSAGFYWSFQQK